MNLKEFMIEMEAVCHEAIKTGRYGSAVIEGGTCFDRDVQTSLDDGETVEHWLRLEPDEVTYDARTNVVRIGFGASEVKPS